MRIDLALGMSLNPFTSGTSIPATAYMTNDALTNPLMVDDAQTIFYSYSD